MSKEETDRAFNKWVGTYVRITCHPSDVSGVILDSYYVIDSVLHDLNSAPCFLIYHMIPKKNKRNYEVLSAKRVIYCIRNGVSYEEKPIALQTNRIYQVTIDDIRQHRKELEIKKVMDA
jgi:hypothetical protein